MDAFDIPGYAEAVDREGRARLSAFLGRAMPICGVEQRPITARTVLLLELGRNALVVGGTIGPADIAAFLWVHSPEFALDAEKRDAFCRRVRKVSFDDSIAAIREAIDDAFADSPPERPSGGPAFASWAAALVDVLAAEYGWAPDEILDAPLALVWQLLRWIKARRTQGAIFINQSDRVRSEWLKQQNDRASNS